MAMLKKNSSQKIITSTCSLVFLAALLIFVAIMIWYATQVGSDGPVQRTVYFGPLALLDITKRSFQGGGYEVEFVGKQGMFWYVFLWVLVAAVTSVWRVRKASQEPDNKA